MLNSEIFQVYQSKNPDSSTKPQEYRQSTWIFDRKSWINGG